MLHRVNVGVTEEKLMDISGVLLFSSLWLIPKGREWRKRQYSISIDLDQLLHEGGVPTHHTHLDQLLHEGDVPTHLPNPLLAQRKGLHL
jgi:hypothetical protein